MKNILALLCFLHISVLSAQSALQKQINENLIDLHQVKNNDENFAGYERLKQEIGNAEIVMLGEQSHGDGTTFETKIKLIKYLHQEMGFDILAFESNIYECDRAWSMIQEGHDVKDALAKGIYSIWSALEEFNPLYEYVEKHLKQENPLMIAGFDSQFINNIAANYFAKDLTAYLVNFDDIAIYHEEIQQLQSFINVMRTGKSSKKEKKKEKKKATQYIAFLQKLRELIANKPNNELSNFWIQSLKNLEVYISDVSLGTDNRDKQMADNLMWLKDKYPDKKIICWGATSHFLYNSSLIQMESKVVQQLAGKYYSNHSMMGDYIKKKYEDNVYTIGFIAHEGSFGISRTSTIELPSENSIEYLIGQSKNDNYFLSLKNISLDGYVSRPLGHQNMVNDISQVMDGVIFNRYMRRPYDDWDFLLYLYPENTIREKKVEKLKQRQIIRKQSEKNN